MSRNFDGLDDRIVVGSGPILNGQSVGGSICAWIKTNNQNSSEDSIYSEDIAAGTVGPRLARRGTNSVFASVQETGLTFRHAEDPSALDINIWTHFAGTFNPVSGVIILYKNGAQVAQNALWDGSYRSTVTTALIGDYTNAGTFGFDGLIAHLSLYKKVLSQSEVNQLMRFPGSVRDALLYYWPLFGFASPEPDYSGNNNSGTVTGAIKGATDPPINGLYYPQTPVLHGIT